VNGRQANILLTRAALLDPRMKRVDEQEQADMAIAWAEVLVDVELDAALEAVAAHYRTSRDPIMPADILTRVGWVEPSPYENITARVAAEQKRRALEGAGVTEAEFEKHQHDAAWIHAHFPEALPAPDQMRDIQQ
jgi:hypothetical protein